jgi:superfamily II DNA or RNA helicase
MSVMRFNRSKSKKLLIIGLPSKTKEWVDDYFTWSEVEDINKIKLGETLAVKSGWTPKRRRDYILNNKPKLISISYQSVWRTPEIMDWVDKDTMIILDESHNIANPTSKQTKFILKLGQKTDDKLILTGTPFTAVGYASVYPQYAFLGITDWLGWTFRKWKDEFAIETEFDAGGFKIKRITGYKKEKRLNEVINKNAFYRKRDKKFEPITRVHAFEKESKRKHPYDDVKKDRVYFPQDESEPIMYESTGGLYAALRKAASGIFGNGDILNTERVDYVTELLENELAGRRVVIFYNYNMELKVLREALDKLGRPYGEYNGAVKDLSGFKDNDDGIALVNYGSGSTGLNDFVIASDTIFYSLPMGQHIVFEQAKGRTDRTGQEGQPMFYVLVKDNTVEIPVLEALQKGKDFDKQMYEDYLNGSYGEISRQKGADTLSTKYLAKTSRTV